MLLRIVLEQPDSLNEWRSISHAVSSALAHVECLRTLDRLRLRGGIAEEKLAAARSRVFDVFRSVDVVEVTATVLDRASQPFPTALGTLDAIHLSTALLWKEGNNAELVLATHDAALGTAGRACGLKVSGV